MFTIKLEAKSTSPSGIAPGSEFGGTVTVPSYRSGLFPDPKVPRRTPRAGGSASVAKRARRRRRTRNAARRDS
jgi:hypothetical protein